MRAYETTYRRQQFRSRLEARWAAFFDLIGFRWDYEPFDADGYIMDFVLSGPNPLGVEVKPDTTLTELERHADRLQRSLRGHWKHDVIVVGSVLMPEPDTSEWWLVEDSPTAGVLGQWVDNTDLTDDEYPDWCWDAGCWANCACQYPVSIIHSTMSYTRNPCGFYDGGHWHDPPSNLRELWQEAGAMTQWKR